MDLSLGGRVAIVTGASRGLGEACAHALAAEGSNLLITGRDITALEEVGGELAQRHGVKVVVHVADLTDPAAADEVANEALAQLGGIDILVNSAGAAGGGLFWEVPDQVWQDSMALKFFGTVRMIRAVLPAMREKGYGRIVSIAGNTGHEPGARLLPSAAANAALLAVTKGLADEVAGDGIMVNAVNPGPSRSGRWTRMMQQQGEQSGRTPEEVEGDYLARIPVGRINEPAEIARLVAFLASDASGPVTGTSITADGGATRSIS
jgi:3-oxoacyl-[acyl-carrier protein] reductase